MNEIDRSRSIDLRTRARGGLLHGACVDGWIRGKKLDCGGSRRDAGMFSKDFLEPSTRQAEIHRIARDRDMQEHMRIRRQRKAMDGRSARVDSSRKPVESMAAIWISLDRKRERERGMRKTEMGEFLGRRKGSYK